MDPRLPPHDPHESPVTWAELPRPTEAVVFLRGEATLDEDRISRAVLALRPGVLIVAPPR